MGVTTTSAARALLRIDKLEAVRRRVSRSLGRCTPGSALAEDLSRQRRDLDEQIAHCRAVVAAAEAAGFHVWSREDFAVGDFVRVRDVWYEVLRVNERSLTVPQVVGKAAGNVVRRADARRGWTWTVGYHDGISRRLSGREMDDLLNPQRPKDHPE